MKILSAADRSREQTGVKLAVFGQFGVGKTSLLKTIEEPTLCLDFEAGMLAVQDWQGDSISVNTWEDARDIACLMGGYNPASRGVYSKKHFDAVSQRQTELQKLLKSYRCLFIDSITIASKLALTWARNRPEFFTEDIKRTDMRGVYGLLALEMSAWLNQFIHIPNKNVVFIGLLDKKIDDFNRVTWAPQIEGSKTGMDLPALLDEVISMVILKNNFGKMERKFICNAQNPNMYPAKDRSGNLNEIEEADLGKLLKKIKNKGSYSQTAFRKAKGYEALSTRRKKAVNAF